jgi:hypothetical protein
MQRQVFPEMREAGSVGIKGNVAIMINHSRPVTSSSPLDEQASLHEREATLVRIPLSTFQMPAHLQSLHIGMSIPGDVGMITSPAHQSLSRCGVSPIHA